jgi:DNA invertase Pin-like site-specific DNA recombinase
MYIVGYVREAPGRGQSETAFAQSEQIRRWALDTGNHIVATCQDHGSAAPTDRPGYRAMIDLVRSGSADAVVVASLDALSPDKIVQEIMLVDIRLGGATVIATNEDDLAILADASDDHARLVVRDVVAQVADYRNAFGLSGSEGNTSAAPSTVDVRPDDDDGRNVVVELIAPTG